MATAYSSEVAVGTYNRLRLRVEYSGTSATCYMEFRRTSSYTGSWADTQASITFNGTTVSAPYNYSGTVGTSWVQLCNASGFSVSTSGGTYNWTFNNPGGSSVLGCSGSITIDAQGTAPKGLSLSNITPGTNQIAATVSVTGWGGLGDASTRFREMSVWEYNNVGGSNRRIQKATGNTLSSTITVTNSSEVSGTLTITPNTKYTLTTFASNGTLYVDQSNTTNTATLATAPTASVSNYTDTTIVISYSTAADGGAYSKNIQYSLDGSTWTTGATVSSASATSGTYTISGLTAGTTYSIRTRVSTTAGTTTGSTLSQKTAQAPTKPTVSGTSGVTSNTISYGTTSFGYPASGTVYLYGGTSSSPTTQLTSKTSTGTSSYTHSSLTANKRYYYRARAYNGKVYSDYSTEISVYTKAAAPTISVSGVTAKTVTIAYSTSADGGAYYKYIDYSLDGTNWTQGATITTSSATSGTFTITGLAPDTSYTIRTKIRTTAAGDTSGPTVTASTEPALYGSVSGHAELVEKFYGSANALGNPPIKGNTTQSASPTPSSPQPVNTVTGEQGVIVAGKNLSPGLSSYAISNYGANSVVKSGNTVTVAVSTSGKGIYFHRVYNASICPQMWQSGYIVSFTISASVPGKVRIGFEQGTIPSYDLTSTPIRVSFTTIVGKNWHIYQDGSTPVTFTISDIQVESGSTATAFSPYAQLYTVNFGGIGKNKFDINSIERGYELLTSGKTSANADWWVSDYIPVKANTAYTSTGVSSNSKCWYDSNKIFVSRAAATTATSPASAAYLRVNGTIASITSDPNVQIEEGSSSTTYEAYQFIELCKIDTYQDYVHKSENDWYIHKEINKIALNGTESWDTIASCFRLRIDDMAGEDDQMAVGAVKSDKFTAASYRNVYNGDVDYGIAQRASGASGIAIRNKDISTVADFKTWLGTSTSIVYYPLATPTETKITNSTLISQLNALWSATTYGDDTNLTVTGEIPAIGTDIFQSTRRIDKLYGSINSLTKRIF